MQRKESDRVGNRPVVAPATGSPKQARPNGADSNGAELGRSEFAARAAALLCGSPREVLARLVQGDPLQLRRRAAQRARKRALLLDGERTLLRTIAHVARSAPRRRGALEVWLGRCVDRALDELLEESRAPHTPSSVAPVLRDFGRQLGMSAESLHAGCAAFHRLPRADRAAFFELVIDARPLDELVREGQPGGAAGSATELARGARRGLLALMSLDTSNAQSTTDGPAARPSPGGCP